MGILTDRDIINLVVVLGLNPKDIMAGEIMSKPLITVAEDRAIGAALDLMIEKNIRRLLVTKGDEIIGIVTQKDLMRGTLDVFHSLVSVF